MTLSEKIVLLRKRQGWSQEDLAIRMDVSRQAVAKWEAGQTVPSLEKILQLSELFAISTDALLKEDITLTSPVPLHKTEPAPEKEEEKKEENDESVTAPPAPPVFAQEGVTSGTEADDEAAAWKSLADLVAASTPGPDDCFEQKTPSAEKAQTDAESGQNAYGASFEKVKAAGKQVLDSLGLSQEQEQPLLDEEQVIACLQDKKKASVLVSYGVFLCILSPVCLLCFAGLAQAGRIKETVIVSVGLSILLLFVACGVFLFIKADPYTRRWEYLEDTLVSLTEPAREYVEQVQKDREKSRQTMIAAGVILCILGAIPIVACAVFGSEWLLTMALGMTLLFIAIGVLLLIRADAGKATEMLLQNGDYTPTAKRAKKALKRISQVYWLAVVAIYLFGSFLTGWWGRSWMIFPVAGILFAIIGAVTGIDKEKEAGKTSRC